MRLFNSIFYRIFDIFAFVISFTVKAEKDY